MIIINLFQKFLQLFLSIEPNQKDIQKSPPLPKVFPNKNLYAHFFQSDHNGMKDLSVMLTDKTDVKDPTREEFWAYKLISFIPLGLNSRDFL